MKVIINKKIVTLKPTNMFGAEGEIFLFESIGEEKCAKIYGNILKGMSKFLNTAMILKKNHLELQISQKNIF